MEIDRKELKRRAREAMGLTRPRFWLVALTYFAMTTGLSLVIDLLLPLLPDQATLFTLSLFFSLLMMLYTVIVQFGLDLWCLWTDRQLDPGLGSLIQGFSVTGSVLWMEISIFLRVVGYALLFSILVLPLMLVGGPVLGGLSVPLMAVLLWAVMLRYALAPYLLADSPDDGAAAAIRRSAELMRGWKLELFKLELSFLGWGILALMATILVQVLFLWQGGFFQALAAFSPAELPDLVTGYSLWTSGIASDTLTQAQIQFFTLYDSLSNGTLPSALSELAMLPVLLWLIPYRGVSRAGFYNARLRLQKEGAPPLEL